MRLTSLCLLSTALMGAGSPPRTSSEKGRTATAPSQARDAGSSSREELPTACADVLRQYETDGGVSGGEVHAKKGSLEPQAIRQVVQEHRPEVLACYKKALGKEPLLKGTVAVRFVISSTGDICALEAAQNTVGLPDLEQCILRAFASWHFPAPKGGGVVLVTYPFAFRPAPPGDGGTPASTDAGS